MFMPVRRHAVAAGNDEGASEPSNAMQHTLGRAGLEPTPAPGRMPAQRSAAAASVVERRLKCSMPCHTRGRQVRKLVHVLRGALASSTGLRM